MSSQLKGYIKFVFFLLLSTMVGKPVLFAQSPIAVSKHVSNLKVEKKLAALKPVHILAEDCGNNIDDDGNGLIDNKDFACYFNSPNPDTCIPSKIVWATCWTSLYWVDLETNADKRIPFPYGEFYDDITWAPNGKLYGAEEITAQIREIDPYTGETKFAYDMPGYFFNNGMTTDAAGNFYLTSFTPDKKSYVVKLNITTGKITVIADLTANNLAGAGDLTFLDGFLYVSCNEGKIIKIDLVYNSFQVYTTSIFTTGYGLITLGDGYLYSCSVDEIFRIDPVTMVTDSYYFIPTYGYIFGMSSYSEQCNAPGCKARLKLNIQSISPYCASTGVILKGDGKGIKGPSAFTWTLPEGQVRNGKDTLTAFTSGKYYLRYHTIPDTCGVTDSISLTVRQYPAASLGKDKLLCTGTQLSLHPTNTEGINDYLWQDGSTLPQYTATQPGIFWMETSNGCGKNRDSILLTAANLSDVFIGNDTLLCAGTSLVIKNNKFKQPLDSYKWSTGSMADSVVITQPGTYWLQSSNTCGVSKDSIMIIEKDSCICRPVFPLINLGPARELCRYDTLLLTNNLHSSEFRYTWQNGSRESNFVARQPGTYWTDVSTYCGTVRDTVIVSEKTVDCECLVYIPSAFTPNNDGKNDWFRPLANCILSGKMEIYNRWGNLVYSTRNLQTGWDGYYNGVLQPKNAYVYYVTYNPPDRPWHYTRKGTFILIR